MKKLVLTVKQQQTATGTLIASILDMGEEIANGLTQRLSCLYGRAPKKREETAKADGHTDKFKVDWDTIKRAIGTPEQTLSEVESGLLRSFVEFNGLTLAGVKTATVDSLADCWKGDVKLMQAVANTIAKNIAESRAVLAEEKARQDAKDKAKAVTP